MWLVWISVALAAPPNPIELGLDLSEWRALPENASEEILSEFIKNHKDSPLAELAWRRILEAEPSPERPRWTRRIAQSHEDHEQALGRTQVSQVVARLHPAEGPLLLVYPPTDSASPHD
jgi:hypothetical protein